MKDKLIEIALKRMSNTTSQGWRVNWQRVEDDYNEIYNDYKNKSELRKIIYDNKSLEELVTLKELENAINDNRPKETISRNKDGSVLYDKLITLHENDVNDDEAILSAFSLSSTHWNIDSLILNLWSVESSKKRLNNYQAKVRVSRKKIDDITLEQQVKALNEIKVIDQIPYEELSSDYKYAIFLSDKHIGSNVHDRKALLRAIQNAKLDIIKEEAKEVNINFLGDILHVDNTNKTTVRGTQQETVGSAYDMVRSAHEVLVHLIKELSIVKTNVYWVQGNHSRLAEFQTFMVLEQYFKNCEHINFYVDESITKAYNIYDTFIGLFHGDIPRKNYFQMFQFDYPEIWGQAQAWETNSGHFHNKNVETFGGQMHTIHGTQSLQSDYEASLGYNNHWKKCEAVLYHKDFGRRKTFLY